MKKIMKNWRSFLTEGEAKYSGILMIKPRQDIIEQVKEMQKTLPSYAKNLNPEDLHVTLVHQSILKPFKDKLKKITLPEPPPVELEPRVFQRKSPGKESWAARLVNQEEVRNYVKSIMELLGSEDTDPEPERMFHISIGNLTGNPHDSVR